MKASTPVKVSLFNYVASCVPATLLKRDSDTGVEAFVAFFETLQSVMKNYAFHLLAIIGFQDLGFSYKGG